MQLHCIVKIFYSIVSCELKKSTDSSKSLHVYFNYITYQVRIFTGLFVSCTTPEKH